MERFWILLDMERGLFCKSKDGAVANKVLFVAYQEKITTKRALEGYEVVATVIGWLTTYWVLLSAFSIDFGIGVLKISHGHDHKDYLLAKKLGLPILTIMNKDGTLNEVAGLYNGLDHFEAQKKLWAELEETCLAVKKEAHTLRVPRSKGGGEPDHTATESQVTSAAIPPDEIYNFVFASVEKEIIADASYLFAIIVDFIRSANLEKIILHPEI
nr:valine--tRNA ligase, chloroplastic/mitochondrial 2 isoform X1 [Tanacetum cinerariifolium]